MGMPGRAGSALPLRGCIRPWHGTRRIPYVGYKYAHTVLGCPTTFFIGKVSVPPTPAISRRSCPLLLRSRLPPFNILPHGHHIAVNAYLPALCGLTLQVERMPCGISLALNHIVCISQSRGRDLMHSIGGKRQRIL